MGRGATYTEEEMYIISSMREAGKSYDEIRHRLAQAGIERSIGSLRNCAHEINNGEKKLDVESALAKLDGIEYIRDSIRGMNNDAYFDEFNSGAQHKKGLVFSDLHFLFEFKNCIKHGLENHPDAEFCVLLGDLFDLYPASAFKKHLSVNFEDEYLHALKYMHMFSSTFKRVYLVEGNHERRLKNYVADKLGNRFNGFMHIDPLKLLAEGYDFNEDGDFVPMHDFSNVVYRREPTPDHEVIGDCIFAHHNNFSTVPMRTAVINYNRYIQDHDFSCLMIGHTHQIGQMIHNGKMLVETGCCCIPPGYVVGSGRIQSRKWSYGYAVVTFDENDRVIFDKTYPVCLGTPTIKKEPLSVRYL